MAWHYVRDGKTQGPVDLPELQRLRQQGIVQENTSVWTEGMTEWTPYAQATAAASTSSSAASAVATHPCVECGKPFPEEEMLNYEGSWVCANCKPFFFQRIKEGVALPGKLAYATVGKRFVAVFIDGILLYVVVSVPTMLIAGTGALLPQNRAHLSPATSLWLTLIGMVIRALYEIILIGAFGATLGKMALKIKVTTPSGGRITYGQATGRYFAKILSSIILGIGYLMAFWDDEKRTLHDRLCGTRVISSES